MRTKKKTFLILALILLLLGGIKLYFGRHSASSGANQNSTTFKVQRQKITQQITLSGVIGPNKKSLLDAPYDGHIQKIYVHVGQKVKKGDPLASIAEDDSSPAAFPLRSSIDGIVTDVRVQDGESVYKVPIAGRGAPYILRVDDMSRVFVEAGAPEIDVNKLKPKMKALVKAQSASDREYHGIIEDIALASVQKEGGWGRKETDFPVSVEIIDADTSLKPGMTVLIDVITAEQDNVLALPPEYTLLEGDQYFAFKKNAKSPEGKEKVALKVGLKSDSFFEIKSGVLEGEEFIPVDFLQISDEQNDR